MERRSKCWNPASESCLQHPLLRSGTRVCPGPEGSQPGLCRALQSLRDLKRPVPLHLHWPTRAASCPRLGSNTTLVRSKHPTTLPRGTADSSGAAWPLPPSLPPSLAVGREGGRATASPFRGACLKDSLTRAAGASALRDAVSTVHDRAYFSLTPIRTRAASRPLSHADIP